MPGSSDRAGKLDDTFLSEDLAVLIGTVRHQVELDQGFEYSD